MNRPPQYRSKDLSAPANRQQWIAALDQQLSAEEREFFRQKRAGWTSEQFAQAQQLPIDHAVYELRFWKQRAEGAKTIVLEPTALTTRKGGL